MILRITVVINKQNCALLYNHCFPDVIDRNIFNVITLHEHCIYAGHILYCILLHDGDGRMLLGPDLQIGEGRVGEGRVLEGRGGEGRGGEGRGGEGREG